MATQVKLPHTLPTPEAARGKLKDARAEMRVARQTVALFVRDKRNLEAERKAAEAELEEAERLMDSAPAGSPELLAAEADEGAAWNKLCGLEKKAANLKAATTKADGVLADCERVLREVRQDLQAIREGRRIR